MFKKLIIAYYQFNFRLCEYDLMYLSYLMKKGK